jgi:hypothetical protein
MLNAILDFMFPSRREIRNLKLRLSDIERHFVTKRDESGKPVETLADVPISKREELRKRPMRGMSWPQRREWLERTDGGRRMP